MKELPGGWVEATLRDVVSVVTGSTPKGLGSVPAGKIPFYKVADMNRSLGNAMGEARIYLDEKAIHGYRLRLAPAGGIIMPKVGGAIATNKKRLLTAAAAFDTNTLAVVPEPGICPEFLFYWLQALDLRDFAYGSPVQQLDRARLLEQSLALPPAPEQRRIVAAIEEHFSRLDAAETVLRRVIRRSEALSRACLSLAVSEGDEARLGDLLDDIEAGKSFRCHARPAKPYEWGVIRVSAMTWGSFDESQNKAVLDNAKADPRWEIKPGDLLLSRANTSEYVGATVLVGDCRDRLLLSDKSMRLRVKGHVNKTWLRFALSAWESRAQMSAVATGTSDSMRNISQEKVKNVTLKVPRYEHQVRIVAEIERRLSFVSALSSVVDRNLRRTVAMRRSVLVQAFTGKLVRQDPSDEPASVLLERITATRASEPTTSLKRAPVTA